ncbi:DUF2269 domain-containing protein [Roseateles cellulosilyticus]|uniref:DUF2269 family protein n=1 Tax=Pelomonas cellulosilytica TaxID=2906762 RepID=UPI0032C2213B
MDYIVAKWLHILSSTLLFGTGLGSAYYLFFTSLGRDPRTVAAVARQVVWADWLFTASTVVFQPLSGFYQAQWAGFALSSRWIVMSLALYGWRSRAGCRGVADPHAEAGRGGRVGGAAAARGVFPLREGLDGIGRAGVLRPGCGVLPDV